ncbi:hypothetical protein [Flavobacterium cerinum]|uniref:Uncharacterized protein n=1 Tax=Flavobacterium cerinum TaxID=2502784 RepID=A0A444GMM5_9FLAO|nr:hypothetical protein [Flavobacterium cerinum]RWW91991.1 hypothetical protein EPI11_17345 [Flavobacterium cerinum]
MKRLLQLFIFIGSVSIYAQNKESKMTQKDSIQAEKLIQLTRGKNKLNLQKTDPEYVERYNKLKELSLKEFNSMSSTDVRIRRKAFNKKLNQKIDSSLYLEQESFSKWIDENIKSTYFVNTKMAKQEWLELNTARKTAIEENQDYYDYLMEIALTVEGTELITDVQVNVTMENMERLKQE